MSPAAVIGSVFPARVFHNVAPVQNVSKSLCYTVAVRFISKRGASENKSWQFDQDFAIVRPLAKQGM
jgi:hypothetical protein